MISRRRRRETVGDFLSSLVRRRFGEKAYTFGLSLHPQCSARWPGSAC